ncbi:uncharacterized protein CcaverHIS019_0507240 [Cutaneotrichosporon cavernicola]|uniref:Utp14-domain-containing protein n=1 Tax=Cutaneotrichosporon cavernicola TaxID=279322 RepID=A0AA48L6S1_9TREE|nr:uncharacterized protein CcaverHIS019_0507240 [Cutaneotrichosporon cavernicola]BEI93096.1 hypothetical protein CcaverHIS019_0507240 [Cutaneotrichosporon cavernicola]
MGRNNGRAPSTRVFSASSSGGGKRKQRTREPKEVVDIDDAYTFDEKLPKRHRTSAAQLSLARDEAQPERPGAEDDDEDMAARIRKVAMQIAGDDAAEVEESDDEDIDSDEAWEEDGSDEERWGDVFANIKKGKGKKGKAVVLKPAKPININLDETDDESDPEVERSPRTAFNSAFPDEEEDEEEDDDEEMEEDDEDEDDEDEDEVFDEDPELPSDLSDDDDDAGMDGLDAFVDSLTSADKKRKTDADEPAAKKRRVLPVQAAPGVGDGDFALKSKTKVDLASLISSNPALSGASALLPSKSDKKSSSVLKSGVLPAPLPTVVQDRIDREAAYEKTREEGQKWSGLMKRVKEAEHLSFPLQAKARGGTKSAGEVVASFKPEGEHESAVDALLAAANLTDKGVAAAEDEALRGQDLSPEEIEARRAELRYQRELMFRAEQKAKRVSKIKSKTFRKLARKRAAKASANGVSLEDLERLDPEAAEEERERLERERARERATLRHGARSRFGRGADGEGTEAEAAERRTQRNEMLEMRDKLQRKIHGRESGESASESEESADEDDEDAIKARAFDQLASLSSKDDTPAAKKGLMQMKFMQKAQERRMREVADEADALRRDIDMFGEENDESEDEDAPQVLKLGEGRMVFSGPGDLEVTDKATPAKGKQGEKKAEKEVPRYNPSPSPEPASANPWLDASASAGPSRKKNAINKSSEAKAVRALKKAARTKDDDVDEVEINVDVGKKLSRSEAKKAAKAEAANDSSDDELLPASGVKAFKQRELVAEAFAGDDVVADFEAEKQAVIDADAPQEVDTTLAGWGGWGGKGVRKRKPNAKMIKKTAGVDAAARKDAGRANVIITEKKDRKAAKYLPTDLPFPFTSVKQYEAQFANPVGSEWNARAGFQRQTLPRVTKKPGAIIEPVRRLF